MIDDNPPDPHGNGNWPYGLPTPPPTHSGRPCPLTDKSRGEWCDKCHARYNPWTGKEAPTEVLP